MLFMMAWFHLLYCLNADQQGVNVTWLIETIQNVIKKEVGPIHNDIENLSKRLNTIEADLNILKEDLNILISGLTL